MSSSSEIQPVALDQADPAGQAVEESNEVQNSAPSAGQRLREAREARGLTIDEVASRLKLSSDQIAALESDEFSRMHCNAIARGFIRNYARLLELDAAELMGALGQSVTLRQNALTVPGSIDTPILMGGRLVNRRNYIWIAAGFVLLFAALLVYLFLPPDFIQTATSSIKGTLSFADAPADVAETQAMPESSAASAPAAPAASANGAIISAPVIIAPGVAPAAPPAMPAPANDSETAPAAPAAAPTSAAPASTPSVATDANDNVLKFSFAQSSWVEVKDRNGKVIFSQLNPSNSQREVSGQPPFSLLIGNASGVSLSYRGKPVDLSKRSKDDVARVTLE